MSENPYSAQSAHTSDFGSQMPSGPVRTSTLAIIAFVIALLSVVGCCVPGLPAVAALLGIFALIGIAKSRGRVKGNGFAITALVIGILLSVVQTVSLIIVNQGLGELTKLSAGIEEIENDQFDALRARLPLAAPESLTDERIIAFRNAYTADTGELAEPPASILSSIGQYLENGANLERINQPGWPYPQKTIPIPATFDNENGFLLFVPEENAPSTPTNPMPLLNLGVMGSDGTTYWLIDPSGGGSAAPLLVDPDAEAPDAEAPETEQPEAGENTDPAGSGG